MAVMSSCVIEVMSCKSYCGFLTVGRSQDGAEMEGVDGKLRQFRFGFMGRSPFSRELGRSHVLERARPDSLGLGKGTITIPPLCRISWAKNSEWIFFSFPKTTHPMLPRFWCSKIAWSILYFQISGLAYDGKIPLPSLGAEPLQCSTGRSILRYTDHHPHID